MTSETMVQVTQGDVAAAIAVFSGSRPSFEDMDRVSKIMAAHRLVERDRIVAALPDEIDLFRTIKQSGARKHIDIARAIIAAHWPERGDHEQGEGR